MIKAVLLDLDNTLILNPDRPFADAFRQLLADRYAESDALIHVLRSLSQPRDPTQTNSAYIVQQIAEKTGCSTAEVRAAYDQFYTEQFGQLRHMVKPIPHAAIWPTALKANGYAVVLATNPIYPESAIRQRLEWGGLDTGYTLITHADNMHFSKPNPAYYAEILARIGTEPDETIMVGDSQRNDLDPAATLGLHTIHKDVFSPSALPPYTLPQPQPEAIIPQLIGSMGALFGLIDLMPDRYWNQRPDPNEWSPAQIVCHLYLSEKQVQRPRLEQVRDSNNPFLSAPRLPSPDLDCPYDGRTCAHEWIAERKITLALLNDLTEDDWTRPARHSVFGPTTLLELASFTAQHDRLHLNQLCQTIRHCQ